MGVESVPPSETVPNLHLISESLGERTLSLYQNSRAAEYELTYVVNYNIVVPEKGSQAYSTKVNRTFLDNPLTALAKSVERDMIEDEMRQQASRQIMRQLARLTAVFNKLEEEELEAMLEGNSDKSADTTVTTEAVEDTQAGNASLPTRQARATQQNENLSGTTDAAAEQRAASSLSSVRQRTAAEARMRQPNQANCPASRV